MGPDHSALAGCLRHPAVDDDATHHLVAMVRRPWRDRVLYERVPDALQLDGLADWLVLRGEEKVRDRGP